jgi:hypothetical protein
VAAVLQQQRPGGLPRHSLVAAAARALPHAGEVAAAYVDALVTCGLQTGNLRRLPYTDNIASAVCGAGVHPCT